MLFCPDDCEAPYSESVSYGAGYELFKCDRCGVLWLFRHSTYEVVR